MLLKELVIDLKQGDAMNQAVDDDGIAPDFREELRQPTAFEQLLRFIQRGAQSVAEAEQPVAGGVAPPGKHLVQVHIAHPGLLCQSGLGYIPFIKHGGQKRLDVLVVELLVVFPEKFIQIRCIHQRLLQLVCVLLVQIIHAFTNLSKSI